MVDTRWQWQRTEDDLKLPYSPLATLDVARTRYEGAFTIVELRPTTRALGVPTRRARLSGSV